VPSSRARRSKYSLTVKFLMRNALKAETFERMYMNRAMKRPSYTRYLASKLNIDPFRLRTLIPLRRQNRECVATLMMHGVGSALGADWGQRTCRSTTRFATFEWTHSRVSTVPEGLSPPGSRATRNRLSEALTPARHFRCQEATLGGKASDAKAVMTPRRLLEPLPS
jgi:hypothetical protein